MKPSHRKPLTVKELKNHLARRKLTPEQFAREVGLGNMTIRRWLKKEDSASIPPKYLPLLGPRLGKSIESELPKSSLARALKNLSMDTLIQELEVSGREFIAAKGEESSPSFAILEKAVKDTLKRVSADKTFVRCCSELLKVAKSSGKKSFARAVAIGALLYFVDPLSMPDDTPLVIYLSELAVLSVALNVANGEPK